jgi:hypothetical protein
MTHRCAYPLLCLALSLLSCQRAAEAADILLPPTPALSIGNSWGVVSSNYLRMRATPSRQSEVLEGLTKGMIVEILSVTDQRETIEDETSYWYRINMEGLKGWVFGAYLAIVDSKSSAEEMAEELR